MIQIPGVFLYVLRDIFVGLVVLLFFWCFSYILRSGYTWPLKKELKLLFCLSVPIIIWLLLVWKVVVINW